MKNTKRLQFNILAGLISSAMLLYAAAASAQDEGYVDDEIVVIEEIVVTGIRGSLERAVNIKRNADSIVDAISAEDLGKFPDQNVSESLQRISGITEAIRYIQEDAF